jgi:hypothetical protein
MKTMSDYQEILVNMSESWRQDALCNKTKTIDWFSEDKEQIKMAKMTCRNCPVADQCLEFAFRNKERFGVWGGFTPRERNKITRHLIKLTKEEAKSLVIKYGNQVLSQTS